MWISQNNITLNCLSLALPDFIGCILIALLISSSIESEQLRGPGVYDTNSAKKSGYHKDFESPQLEVISVAIF